MRTCRCSECRDPRADLAAGTVEWLCFYGNSCANCGFYSPANAEQSFGYCLKFQLLARGAAPEVRGAFSCCEFRPYHDTSGRKVVRFLI